MKRFACAAGLVALMSTSMLMPAQAADIGASTGRSVYRTATPAPSWAGMYLGVEGGLANGCSNVDANITGFGTFANGTACGSGGVFGAFGGYRWQSGNLTYGLEGMFDVGGPRGTTNLLGVDGSYSTKWNMAIGPTVGYSWGDLHLQLGAGIDVAKFGFNANGFGLDESWSQTKTGWYVAPELDYRLTRNWYVGARYEYANFGTLGHDMTSLPGVDIQNHLASHTLKLKVGYQF